MRPRPRLSRRARSTHLDLLPIILGALVGCSENQIIKSTAGEPTGPVISVSPTDIALGGVAPGEAVEAVVTVTNVGIGTLEITGTRFDGAEGFTLTDPGSGEGLGPDASTELWLSYRPSTLSSSGHLVIGNSDPAQPEALVSLSAEGLFPALVFDPNPVIFDEVVLGTTSEELVSIVNSGTAPLVVDTLAVIGEGYELLEAPSLPITLEPGASAPLTIGFTSLSEGWFPGELWAESNTLGSPSKVPLQAGSSAPVALCSVAPDEIEVQIETATWFGSESYSPSGEPITEFRWTLIDQPDGSEATMPGDTSEGDRVGFTADLVGTYVGELVVVNSAGLESAPCIATLEAVTSNSLWVEMWWQEDHDDMDLHLLAPGGALTTSDDCFYGNCVTSDLDWGVTGASEDDPSLDLDDIPGTGPENIHIELPADGAYSVYVHDYPDTVYNGENAVTVRVYIDGELLWEATKGISGENDYIPFAVASFPDGTVSDL